ncbi:MAG: hypothetical protein ACLP00_02025 [Terracidiphilus sp.]
MEADWEIEIGGDAPVIDAYWPGFVDLRRAPEKVCDLPEVLLVPALARALVRLNASESPLFTVKCDVWPVTEIDPFEFDATPESAVHGIGVYIDLLSRDPELWLDCDVWIAWCKRLCAVLQATPLRCCRADIVIRRAIRMPDVNEIGITAYFAACGSTVETARAQLESLLAVFADSMAIPLSRGAAQSKLQ